jgi:ABC-type glycerol-3-phosphate transport system permease component
MSAVTSAKTSVALRATVHRTPMQRVQRIGFWVLVVVLGVFCLFPFYWALVSSFKGDLELFQVPPTFYPHSPTLINYNDVIFHRPFPRNILNSIVVSTANTVLSLVVGIFCAYSLARLRFRGRSLILGFVLAVVTFPTISIINPLFVEIKNFGWYNTYQGLIGPYLVFSLPFSVWLLTTFFRELPREIEEAAMVDGCTFLQTMFLVMLPLATPAMVTIGLLNFINSWNELVYALTFTIDDNVRTVPAAIIYFNGQYQQPWGSIMAASVLVTVPLIALVLVFQGRIVAGLTAGGVKG